MFMGGFFLVFKNIKYMCAYCIAYTSCYRIITVTAIYMLNESHIVDLYP